VEADARKLFGFVLNKRDSDTGASGALQEGEKILFLNFIWE